MKIFLSAVSSQFKACRDALASDLRAVGARVVVQEDFQQAGRSLLEKLEAYIDGCDRVIALVGDAYGAAPGPDVQPPGAAPRSYTQWEYFFAQGERLDRAPQAARQIFVYLASPDFMASHPVEQTASQRRLQEDFVAGIRRSAQDRSEFGSLHELRALVLRDGFRLDEQTSPATAQPAPDGGMLSQEILAVLSRLAAAGQSPRVEDLFEIIADPESVPAAVFRTARRPGVSPYEVPYLAGRESTSDFRTMLDEAVLASGGALLLQGRAGTGKTREVAELATRFCERGWVICVAKGEGDTRMDRPASFPDALRGARVLFILDDLHRRVTSTGGDRPYIERLSAFVEYMEANLLPGEMFFVATTRSETHHRRQLGFDSADPVWQRFRTLHLPEYSNPGLQAMLVRLAGWAGVEIDPERAVDMVRNSDRTPRTLVLNVDRARRLAKALTPALWLPAQGRSWEVCFQEACGFWPAADSVFRSLHLVHAAGIPTRDEYVEALASELAGGDARPAIDGLSDMGLLGSRAGLLDAFADEQLRDSLLAAGQRLPRIEDHWQPLGRAMLAALDANDEWLQDLASLMTTSVLGPAQREWLATGAIARGQRDPVVFAWRAFARFGLGDYTGAESDSTQAAALGHGEAAAVRGLRGLARLGKAMDELGAARTAILRDAEADFDAVLVDEPDSGVAWYFRGIARAELGDLAAAERDLGQAMRVGWEPGPGTACFRRGQTRQEQHKYREAEADYSQAIEQGYEEWTVFNGRANVRIQLLDLDGAYEDFSVAIDRGRSDAGAFVQRGMAALGRDRFAEAERDFTEAARRAPDLADAYYFRAMVNAAQDKDLEAERDYSRAIELGSEQDDVHARRGSARQRLERFADAEDDFTRAIESGMDTASVYVSRAFTRLYQARCAAASEDFTRAIERGADDAAIYFFRGITQDDPEVTESDLSTALDKGYDQGDVYVFTHRAIARIALGRLAEAREDCERAREIAPDDPATQGCWGDLHLALGEYEDAIACYRAAASAEDACPRRFALGLALLLGGHWADAEAAYARGIDMAQAEDAQEAVGELERWLERSPEPLASPDGRRAAEKILHQLLAHRRTASGDGADRGAGPPRSSDPAGRPEAG